MHTRDRYVLVVLLAFCLPACAPALSIGNACVRDSDCAAPYACIASRCREECVDHRDCTLPSRCLVGNDGIAACTLEGDRCDPEHPCAEDLVCNGNACFDGCISGSCPAGGECSGGLCVRPTGSDAGNDAGVDAPPADVPPSGRTTCTTDAACGASGACTRISGGAFVCRPRCTTIGDCTLGNTSLGCVFTESIEGGYVTTCSLPCDLFGGASSGCPAGEACDVFELNTRSGMNAIVVDCRAIDPAMFGQDGMCGPGGGSWDPTLCAAGFVCDGTGSPYTCQQICTTGGALGPMCPAGTTCAALPVGSRFAGATLGSCDPI